MGSGLATATTTRSGGRILLRNGLVEVAIDADGLFSSVRDLVADRELIPAGTRGNLLQLHRDVPSAWDAWDLDASYSRLVTDLTEADSVEIAGTATCTTTGTTTATGTAAMAATGTDAGTATGTTTTTATRTTTGTTTATGTTATTRTTTGTATAAGTASVRIERSFGASRISQVVSLAPGRATIDLAFTIDWHERQKLLKLAFPLDVHADRAASEIQFGHVFRPTHANTSWDAARYETVAHRWVHVGEPGYGVAVANDSTYGHDIARTTDAAGHPATTVRLSLLRAPLYPDPDADQGEHALRVSIGVGAGIPEAIAEGYRLNLPLRTLAGVAHPDVEPLLHVDNPAVVIEAVKLAEDRSGDVVVRLYEAHGSRARATLIRSFDAAEPVETDLLERALAEPRAHLRSEGTATALELRPFQLVTLRFGRSG